MKKLMFTRANLAADLVAGLTSSIVGIPDAMASAVLAGVNPIHGLYSMMVGTPAAALTTGSQFMSVVLTSAMALAVGDALTGLTGDTLIQSLVVLTLLVGVFQLALGLLRLGGLTRFVSNAVMVGFLTGVAVLIILGQLGDFAGYDSPASNKLLQAWDLLRHLNQIDLPTLAIGTLTLVIVVIMERTRLRSFSMLAAIIFASVLVQVFRLDSIAIVGDISDIPRSLPLPILPDLSLIPGLIAPAIAVGIIGLVQGAGVSKSVPNPDGNLPDASRDFSGQGLANLAAGFFRGMPLGGSLSGTAVTVKAGARSRWANFFTGLFVAAIVLLFGPAVELVPMASMSALLIIAGYQTLDSEEIADVWDVSIESRLIMILTFAATLVLPIQYAVFLGVAVSILHYAYSSAVDIDVVEIVPQKDGTYVERPAPRELPSERLTLLHIYGSLFFAGASVLEQRLPSAQDSRQAIVLLRLRGHPRIGSTFIGVIERYADRIQANGGKLMLVGVSEKVKLQLDRTETTDTIPDEDIFLANDTLGSATNDAWAAARAWLEHSQVRDQDRLERG